MCLKAPWRATKVWIVEVSTTISTMAVSQRWAFSSHSLINAFQGVWNAQSESAVLQHSLLLGTIKGKMQVILLPVNNYGLVSNHVIWALEIFLILVADHTKLTLLFYFLFFLTNQNCIAAALYALLSFSCHLELAVFIWEYEQRPGIRSVIIWTYPARLFLSAYSGNTAVEPVSLLLEKRIRHLQIDGWGS